MTAVEPATTGKGVPSLMACVIALAVVSIVLRVVGFRRTTALISRLAISRKRAPTKRCRVDVVANRIALAGALCPGRARCLEQALITYILLRRGGYDAILRVGVRTHGFHAHAWVEIDGSPVNEADDDIRNVVPILGVAR